MTPHKYNKTINHNKYMRIALDLASKGLGFTSPNPMVGSLVVKENKIVGKGYHKKAGDNHAEINAINEAGKKANGATLYVTLEPCNHTGKTPPCTKKILDAGIKHVVFPIEDPNPNVSGGGSQFLKKHGVKITTNVCKREAIKLNENFIKYVKTGLPFVIAKCASTLNGQIATSTGDSKWVTGYEARQYGHKIRHSVDAIMVGKNTINYDNPSLTTRLDKKNGIDPARIVLDTKLSISHKAKIITQNSSAQTYIVTGKNIDRAKKKLLEKLGATVIVSNEKNNKIDINALIKLLGNMGFTSLLIEGGGELIGSVFSLGIVDKIYFFYAPKILPGSNGIPVCKGIGPSSMKNSINIQDMSVLKLGKDILVHGYIKKP